MARQSDGTKVRTRTTITNSTKMPQPTSVKSTLFLGAVGFDGTGVVGDVGGGDALPGELAGEPGGEGNVVTGSVGFPLLAGPEGGRVRLNGSDDGDGFG